MKKILPGLVAITLIAIVGCSSNKSSGANGFAKTSFEASVAGSVTLDGAPVTAVGVTITPPKSWTDQGPSSMRITTYAYGPIEQDKDSAILAISYFGKDGGGPVKGNLLRWIHQMQLPDSANPESVAVQSDILVDGMAAHIVELGGTYLSGGMMGTPPVPKENYRLTGVILETPEGNLFFKLTGPAKTATKMAQEFAAVLLNLKKAASTM